MIRLFRVFIPTSVFVLTLTEFVLIFGCFLVAAFVFITDDLEIFLLYDGGIARLAIMAGIVMLSFYFQDLYNDFNVRSKMVLLQQCVFALGIAILVQSFIAYVLPAWITPRRVVVAGSTALILTFPFWRVAYQRYLVRALGMRSVLFLGANPLVQEIAAKLQQRPELGLHVIGFIDDSHCLGDSIAGMKALGRITDLAQIVEQFNPDSIVVGLSESRQKLPTQDLLNLRFSGFRIEEAATMYQTAFSRIPAKAVRPSQLIFSSELGPLPRNLQLQTVYSTVLAAVALAIASPIMLLVAIAVRMSSPGPVLFRQIRVGMRGKPFTMYKFRSMIADAEARTGAVWASKNDPRITAVGAYLRKTRLDELPQLFNVLRGEMSIVGPRPERPEFVQTLSELIPFYGHRHSVKPGITGWAQINYKYGETIEDALIKLEYDLYYIKNLSMSLDFYTMLHTAKAMLVSKLGQ
jgi:exopolysaccharide biosynthesis polyprenyl glycosylphosphotransferase